MPGVGARLVRDALLKGRVHFFDDVLHREPLHVVGLIALGHVLREGELGTAVDGEAVVFQERDGEAVVAQERDELHQAVVPGKRAKR